MAAFAHFITNRMGIYQDIYQRMETVLRVKAVDPIVTTDKDPPHSFLDPESPIDPDQRRDQVELLKQALMARTRQYQPSAIILLCRSVHGSGPRDAETDLPILRRCLPALHALGLVDEARLIGLLPCYVTGRWSVHQMFEIRHRGQSEAELVRIGFGRLDGKQCWEIVTTDEIVL